MLKVKEIKPMVLHEVNASDFPKEYQDELYQEAVEDYYRHYDSADGDFGWRINLDKWDAATTPWYCWLRINIPVEVYHENKLGIKFYQ